MRLFLDFCIFVCYYFIRIQKKGVIEVLRQPNIQGQITIPKEFLKQIGFDPNSDYFDIELKDDTIVLKPVTVEPKYTKEELNKIEKLFKDPKNKGKVYKSSKEALKALRKMMKK